MTSDRPALLLDAHSLVYRAFYALPPMTTRAGVPTSGLYGLSVLLVKLLREEQPRALAFAADAPGPTERHVRYPAYKRGRAPTPDPLRAQLHRLPELADALGVPFHRIAGWEADDLLATLAAHTHPSLVVSGDTDLLQIVDASVTVLFVGRRQKDHVRYDPATVEARYGFTAARLPTYKALAGDASDNLPGVPGIGAKTAAKLVAAHGDLRGILSATTLAPRVRAQLDAYAERLAVWEDLATVRRDLPLGTTPTVAPFTPDGLRAWFEVNEFRSLIPRLDAIGGP